MKSNAHIVDQMVHDLLDRIDKTYPPQRRQAIKTRTNAFWLNQQPADRLPYAVLDFPRTTEAPSGLHRFDQELIEQLAGIAGHGEAWDDDYFPALSPGCRQITLPSNFGCVEEAISGSARVKPLISQPQDVYDLPDLDFAPETAGGEMLEKMRVWRDKTEGRIALYETDMQGPFSVASQVWGVEDFLYACHDCPETVHTLIDACTKALIKFTHRMFEAARGDLIPFHCMPCLWFPPENGMALSEDLVAVVSADFVTEFMQPYLEKIAHVFGGVCVHTCGSMNHVIPALCRIQGLKALNFSSCETDLLRAIADKEKSVKIVCHNSPVTTGSLALNSPLEHAAVIGTAMQQTGESVFSILMNCDQSLTSADDAQIQQYLQVPHWHSTNQNQNTAGRYLV